MNKQLGFCFSKLIIFPIIYMFICNLALGSSYTQVGNTTYGSDGSSYTQVGNTTYGSDGDSYTQVGNTTYGSDGSSCTQVGNTTYVNP